MSGSLTIAVLADSADLLPLLSRYLSTERYTLLYFTERAEFLDNVELAEQELDCLVFYSEQQLLPVINHLYDRGKVLPVVIIHRLISHNLPNPLQTTTPQLSVTSSYIYQPSEVILAVTELSEIAVAIDKAIAKFLNLTPIVTASEHTEPPAVALEIAVEPNFLLEQQSRLAHKLSERLGYLAVYYRRSSSQFFRHLDRQQKQELLEQLKSQYRSIVLDYFADSNQIDLKIDEFVSSVFFRDLAVSEIVKIHMELMEKFSNQLKLEGRSEEILLDYRLTLIDIIAHLCEMYRRSVPREM
ncbi:circadian clock protein KaiA [Chamaesiphon sp.]|uniref:circadian clock protein KaiA n=1 Tax=Chamaesiphon sp. TaxID=2814140 RepID=UPI003593B27C